MLGNVAEWTISDYKKLPYKANDGRNAMSLKNYKVTKGGSWSDLSYLSTVASRVPYKSYQRVFNVGIRLVLED